jgi:hypothetical protein
MKLFPTLLLLVSLAFSTVPLIGLPEGYLDVTTIGADPSGQTDSTAALQQGINQARDEKMILWFPAGTYRVSDRLIIDQPDDDNEYPGVLVGSTQDPSERATLFLVPGAEGFNDSGDRKALVHFLNEGPPKEESGNTDLFNQAFISIDIRIGSGNAGAVALRMQGAEGCTIQDVNIDLTAGGHTGIWGIPGSGGSTHKVSVNGGVYGIDTRSIDLNPGGTQPTAVVTGSTFSNQSEAALFATTRGSFVLVGCRITKDMGGACILLTRNWAGQPFDASLQLIDCEIDYSSFQRTNFVIESEGALGRSFYLNNTFVRNARRLYGSINANSSGWRRFDHAAVEVRPESRGWWDPEESVYLDGVKHGESFIEYEDVEYIPGDLMSRHQWPADFPTWESDGVVDVTSLGAVGDGETDNWQVLQDAIDAHETLFFPKGDFRVSKTLSLRPESKLIGAYPTLSSISAIASLDNRFNDVPEGEAAPIVKTADTADAETYLAFLHLRRAWPLDQHDPTPPGNYSLEWRSGGDSIIRHILVISRPQVFCRPDRIAEYHYGLDTTINPNHPQADFPDGMWAWPCNSSPIQIRGNGGGRWYNFWMHGRQGLREHIPFLLVEDTEQPLHIYHLHLQQQDSQNHAEIRNASNVSIYGTKAELKGSLVYAENCRNLRIFGNGGLSSPDHEYFPPYLFRFINCRDYLISGIGDTIQEGSSSWVGGAFDRWIRNHFRNWYPIQDVPPESPETVIPSNERPILYMRGSPAYTPSNNPFPPSPWNTAQDLGDNYYQLPWFGVFYPYPSPYIYHLEHGFLYYAGTTLESLWVWDAHLGWVWTNAQTYPFLYWSKNSSWLFYYRGGTPRFRYFFDLRPDKMEPFHVP